MDADQVRKKIEEEVLPLVEKPARYLGTEWNRIKKEWTLERVKMAFAFPDVYEVGMSHLGLKILYGLVNEKDEYLMERAFAPGADMEKLLRAKQIPLFSLESYQPLSSFDVIGFTLQYEMSYTNILNMLDMSYIPIFSKDRDEDYPLIIAGGPCVYNPEPLAPFIDLFVVGEGEELLLELMEGIKSHRAQRAGKMNKQQLLQELVTLKGIYIPSYYDVIYDDKGRFVKIEPNNSDAPLPVVKRIVKEMDDAYFPEDPIVPFMEVVHDRAVLEVLRGCARGCRFCQAGMVYRPVRERSPQVLYNQAKKQLSKTGYSEVSLTSLSTSDYTCVEPLLMKLVEEYEQDKVGVSLPSLRVDSFSVDLAQKVQKVRKTGLTFAPEAGTQRLRDVINKGVTEENLRDAVTSAFKNGWTRVKLYFMIGLPTETYEDLDGIANLANMVLNIGKEEIRRLGLRKPVQVTVGVSSFVPKPHTPFQWAPQDSLEVLREKQDYLKKKIRSKQISLNWHDAEVSFLEAVFAKGDRRLADVLAAAFGLGCKFDGWNEHFKYDKWIEAFAQAGIDPHFYANEAIELGAQLPWEHIQPGVNKNFLQQEYERALGQMVTGDCRHEQCPKCGVCGDLKTKNKLYQGEVQWQLTE